MLIVVSVATASLVNLPLLIRGAAKIGGVDPERATRLGQALLAAPVNGKEVRGGRSGLNNNGSPLQFCMSASADGIGYRLLADPASELADPLARYRASYSAIESVLDLTGSSSIDSLFQQTLQLNLPSEEDKFVDYPDGVMWLAANLDGPGCAMYVDARRGGEQVALERLGHWLTKLCSPTNDIDALLRSLKIQSRLMCLGVEGVSPAYARAKVYWRLAEAVRLDQLGLEGFKDRSFTEFLSLSVGQRRINLTGIVLNAGIDVATGNWADVKLDVCGCQNCLNYSAAEAIQAGGAITSHFGLASLPLAEALEYGELAFFGLGLDARGKRRFNVYLRPFSS